MPTFTVYEVYEEIRLLTRKHEIVADSEDEALDIASDSDAPPDRKGDDEYGPSGFYIRGPGEQEDGTEWEQAIVDMETKKYDT